MSIAESTPNAKEDREDESASSGTICCVAVIDRVRHGVVVETELAIMRGVEEREQADQKRHCPWARRSRR